MTFYEKRIKLTIRLQHTEKKRLKRLNQAKNEARNWLSYHYLFILSVTFTAGHVVDLCRKRDKTLDRWVAELFDFDGKAFTFLQNINCIGALVHVYGHLLTVVTNIFRIVCTEIIYKHCTDWSGSLFCLSLLRKSWLHYCPFTWWRIVEFIIVILNKMRVFCSLWSLWSAAF